jgi:SAM-dependent methyltransferase
LNNDAQHFDELNKWFTPDKSDNLLVEGDFDAHPDGEILKKLLDHAGSSLAGKLVYIPGCGSAYEAIPFARRGCSIYGIDISPSQVEMAQCRAKRNNVENLCAFRCADAMQTDFPDNHFDFVIAHAVIHHFDYAVVAKEFHRILKPGGKIVFSEPFAENPVLNFIRDRVPYPYKHRTPDEHPLTYRDIEAITSRFTDVRVEEVQLFSMIERLIGRSSFTSALFKFDSIVSKLLPFSKRFCRYVVFSATK